MEKFILNNGLTCLFVPKKDSFSTTILILVRAGSLYETKQISGISHFLEHMAFKGTKKRKTSLEISSELDSLGAKYNAFTSSEFTGYWIKVQNKYVNQALDLISDIYLNPLFKQEEIEKERGVIMGELNMYNDSPEYKVQDLFLSLLYGDQPAGWPIIGKKENILKFKRQDFLRYRSSHYIAPHTVLVVSGQIHSSLREEIKSFFTSLKKGKRLNQFKTKKYKKSSVILQYKKTDQTHLILGAKTCSLFAKERYPLSVLSTLLGGMMSSRLFQEIREKLGAGYYISSSNNFFKDYGFLSVSAGINHPQVEKAISVIVKELEKLKKYKVSLRELKKTKDYKIGNFYLSLESSNQWANFFGVQEIREEKIKTPNDIVKNIQKVSPWDIKTAADKFFKKSNLYLALIGPFKNKEKFITIMNK